MRNDRLYNLLPVVIRQRDADQGEPLRALLEIIAEQVDLVENDIAQLYENWFIETCADWVVPYIGDLVGYRSVSAVGMAQSGQMRRDVANTIRARRRKGTLSLLEHLVDDVTDWPSRVIEMYPFLVQTQRMQRPDGQRGRLVSMRDNEALERLNGPFDPFAHTVDVRNCSSPRNQGRYNLPNVIAFVWRLKTYSVTLSRARKIKTAGSHCYTFSPLGNDTPLYTHSEQETDPSDVAGEYNLPTPIRRRALKRHLEQYYGQTKSFMIWIQSKDTLMRTAVPLDQIEIADLRDWKYRPEQGKVAVDPLAGRIIFSSQRIPAPAWVWVSYHYARSDDIGGGPYQRSISDPQIRAADQAPATVYRVGKRLEDIATIAQAIEQWQKEQPDQAVIEIADSGEYAELFSIVMKAGQRLQIRAAVGERPVIRLPEVDDQNALVTTTSGGCITLDGLLIAGEGIKVAGPLQELIIRHCTIIDLNNACEPGQANPPSLKLDFTSTKKSATAPCVTITHSIIGPIEINDDEVRSEPIRLHISDSIVDATSDGKVAIGGVGCRLAHASLTVFRSTIIGQGQVHAIALAEDAIFTGYVCVARRQTGCMRFCYVPYGSRTPRRYNCQPDLVEQAAQADGDAAVRNERSRVKPWFKDNHYGEPGYCQLADGCADEIKRGASDEAEMGVFHNLYQPQRAANLRARLAEYTPAGVDIGIVYVS